jgi:hypothetical protein
VPVLAHAELFLDLHDKGYRVISKELNVRRPHARSACTSSLAARYRKLTLTRRCLSRVVPAQGGDPACAEFSLVMVH